MRCALLGALLFTSTPATAEPVVLRVDRPSLLSVTVKEDPAKSKVLDLPAGYFFNDDAYQKLDTELQRLQVVEAEHAQENTSKVLAASFFIGLTLGAGLMLAATRPWEAK